MSVDHRFDILLEPIRIGPVTARNRFYQVPHCNGMGYRDPTAVAHMRGVKAEGGWAVVCTEQVELHYSSEITPYIELRLWDDRDIPIVARMADKIHEHGALAGLELAYNGLNGPNYYSREVPMAPTALPVATFTYDPVQARSMNRQDIRNVRRWHRAAALRARRAGFDLVYVYAGHALGFLQHFISRPVQLPHRRVRRVAREPHPAPQGDPHRHQGGHRGYVRGPLPVVDGRAPGFRGAREGRGRGRGRLAGGDSGPLGLLPRRVGRTTAGRPDSARRAGQEPYIAGLKRLTTKPVVGVGRYTSPDRMAAVIRKGLVDLIGCARPSISDPFLPRKVAEGRLEDIRECIGCNICVSGDFTMSPIRCTQNPTMGEEWRRGWHPEYIRARESEKPVLIVGAGPAGLEAAQALGKRGYAVTLAEKGREPGGRVRRESRLPGLAAWSRVVEYRVGQLHKLPNVEVYYDSELDAAAVLEFGAPRVVLATGARWRSDGVGHRWTRPMPVAEGVEVLTPDDLMEGRMPGGQRVLVWDDDHYYMGGVLAELLAEKGFETVYATPASEASTWTRNTMEQFFIQARLLEKGVRVETFRNLDRIAPDSATLACVHTGRSEVLAIDAVVLVTSRSPVDELAVELAVREAAWNDAGIESVEAIGDACAPATIAHAVYAGRRYAEELDGPEDTGDSLPFRRELTELADH